MPNTILIADDDLDSRFVLKLMLERQGYTVLEAGDGYEALYIATRNEVDLIIMDMSMPLMDGINATKHLKSSEETKNIPIVAHTAFSNFYLELTKEAGADGFVTKPVDMPAFLETIKRFLKQPDITSKEEVTT